MGKQHVNLGKARCRARRAARANQHTRVEAALLAGAASSYQMAEHLGIEYGYYTVDGLVVFFNSIALQHLGLPHQDLTGKSVFAIYSQPLAGEIMRRIRLAAISEGSQEYEDYVGLAQGPKWFLSHYSRVLNQAGGVEGVQIISHDMTARKQAEKDLWSRREYLYAVLDSSNDAVFVNDADTGQIIDVNQRMCEMYGYTRLEALRISIGALSQGDPPYSQAEALHWLWQARQNGPQTFEWLARHKDGHCFWVEVSIRFTVIGGANRFVVVVHDIAERKRAEASLRALLTRHEALLAAIPEIVMEVDNNKIYRWANRAGLEFFGEDVVGREAADYFEGEQDTYRLVQPVFNGTDETTYVESWQRRKDGARRLLAWWCRSLRDGHGNITGALSSSRDITESRQAEQAIKEYSERLEMLVAERTRELQQAHELILRQERLAVLGQLAGGVGHELRNPLAVMSNAVYFLKLIQPDASDKVKEYLNLLENEIRAAEKIIADLLDFSRLKSVEQAAISVTSLVQQTIKRCPSPPGVTVTVDIPADLPPAYADPRHVLQVLGNLVVNACQAMPEGGVLALGARLSGGEALPAGQTIAIYVRDTGTGISASNMEKIFDPLFTTKPRGVGLGLPICKKLVEANGGWLEVQSQEGQGSTFTVYLQVAQEVA